MKNEIKFLGENLYKFRKEKGISQEELANKIGVSRQAVYKWETGERIPDITNLNALCLEFDKNIEDFIVGAEYLIKKDSEANKEVFKEDIKKEKNNKTKNTIKILIIIVVSIYLLTVVIKAAFFSMMFAKMDKYKFSNNYMYQEKRNNNEDGYCLIQYKDGIQTSFVSDGFDYLEVWSYYKNVKEKATFGIDIKDRDKVQEEWKYNYIYQEGFNYYKEPSPYELVSEIAMENYNIKNILNPLYILNIDFKNKDLIFEVYDKDPKSDNQVYIKKVYYIDLETGLLSKKEKYELDKLVSSIAYFNYEFDKINNSLEIGEDLKKQIIEGYKKQEELEKMEY